MLPQPPNPPPSWRVAPGSTTPGQDAVGAAWGDTFAALTTVHDQQMYALRTFAYVAGGIW